MSGRAAIAVMASVLGMSGADRLVEGKPDSAVRIIVYEDLQCPDCAAFRRMMDETLLPRFGARAAFEHRDFPLAKHAWARKAAIAARYFQSIRPELAVEFRRRVMAKQREITPETLPDFVKAFAKGQRIDPSKAASALDDAALGSLVDKDVQDGVARGVSRTPTVLVNGRPFVEPAAPDEVAAAIDEELKMR